MTEAERLTSDSYPAILGFIHTRIRLRQARLCMAGGCRGVLLVRVVLVVQVLLAGVRVLPAVARLVEHRAGERRGPPAP